MSNWLARFVFGETKPVKQSGPSPASAPRSPTPGKSATELAENIRKQVGGPPQGGKPVLPGKDNGVQRTLKADEERARTVLRDWLKQGD
ncbi:MAG: hypothetical protein HQL51_01585 [Magnetococcales bacterium]|nr:hypothetical protein [Magnetococcales bacterium]